LPCASQAGANVVAAKTDQRHPRLEGTIHETVEEIEATGGRGLAIRMDVRDDESVDSAVAQAVDHFGGLDMLVNNASAIMLQDTRELQMKRFDLMFDVNVRGTYTASRACIPHLLKSANAHVLNLSPPLNLNPAWFKDHVAYTMSKYGMSMCIGHGRGVSPKALPVNALWPRTVIATAAISLLQGAVVAEHCRTPDIMADAAFEILIRDSRQCTGNFFLDENVLRGTGVKNFDHYQVRPGQPLVKDLFLD
jgi:citronellol/citronellal dehydrogenase